MHFHIDYVPNAVVHRIGPFFKTWCAVCHAVASAVAREGGANVVSCISRFKTSFFPFDDSPARGQDALSMPLKPGAAEYFFRPPELCASPSAHRFHVSA